MSRPVMDLEALLRVPYVDSELEFDISPDGAQVAFSWNASGQWEVYVLSLDGTGSPQQVTTGPGAKFNPRWSPDGSRLAYALDLEGSECFDLYVHDLATGAHRNLTPDTPDAIQPLYDWSPDGTEMVFISDRSGCFDTYVMPAAGGQARLLLDLPYSDRDVRWSPDGHRLAVVAETIGQDFGVFIVSPGGGELLAIGGPAVSPAGGRSPVHAKDPCWSPDGRAIAFASNLHGSYQVGVYDVATGAISWVTDGKGDKEYPDWSPDGRRLVFVTNDGPLSRLTVLDLGTRTMAMYEVGAGVHHHPRFTPDGGAVVLLFDNPGHPCDLWLLSLADGSTRALTCSLPPRLRDASFAMPVQVEYPSLDGRSVPALLYRPVEPSTGAESLQTSTLLPPAVIAVHGGPSWLAQFTWDPFVQHLVGRGWVVLAPNYRGSTGYGREWQLANRFDLGGGDTKDVVAGADYLVCEGLADPARIAVTGASYGGYMTMTSLTQYPDRWAAGSAVVPFLNWFTEFANERPDLQHWDRENFGDPEKDRDLYRERSPFFFLDRVTAPVQLICGMHDPRCPASESIQARDELLAQGRRCDFVLYEDEGHGFLKTDNLVDATKRQVAFLVDALEAE